MTGLDPNLLVHSKDDHAGIAIMDIKTGEKALGLILTDHTQIEINAVEDIPLGHKMAVKAVAAGDKIVLNGHSIGAATQAIKTGEHMHTHNVKSLRWS